MGTIENSLLLNEISTYRDSLIARPYCKCAKSLSLKFSNFHFGWTVEEQWFKTLFWGLDQIEKPVPSIDPVHINMCTPKFSDLPPALQISNNLAKDWMIQYCRKLIEVCHNFEFGSPICLDSRHNSLFWKGCKIYAFFNLQPWFIIWQQLRLWFRILNTLGSLLSVLFY